MWGASYPEEQRPQSYRYASDKPSEIDPASPLKADTKALENRQPCREPKGQSESDLCAQWRAAYAAEDSALWAKWSFWTGLAGIGGLLASLYYTREAVRIAADATSDAENSLDLARQSVVAAQEQVAISRRTAKLELRPYLSFLNADFSIEEEAGTKFLNIHLAVRNAEETSAINAILYGEVKVFEDYRDISFDPIDQETLPSVSIARGGKISRSYPSGNIITLGRCMVG